LIRTLLIRPFLPLCVLRSSSEPHPVQLCWHAVCFRDCHHYSLTSRSFTC
jgi:hypothetical protein